ncbi:hypothetical protein KJ937_02690, partial [Patescibacteria group bacterium]|nr:hypothetical protein [Patescibacteria group bacterium]
MPRRSNAAEQMPEPASQAKKSSKPVDEDVLRFYHKPPTRLKPKEVPDEKVVIRKDVKRKAEYASEIERPKVMIGKKALEAQEEAETMKRIEELRTKHNEATSVEKLSKRSETERSLAHKLINEFETGLKNGKITKSEMSHYRHELMEIRDKFEELQGQGVAISGEMQISDILNENLKVKDQVLDAIQASNMEDPQDALAKFKYGTGEAKYGQKHVVNVEKMEETDPEIISSQIEAKYGYHP